MLQIAMAMTCQTLLSMPIVLFHCVIFLPADDLKNNPFLLWYMYECSFCIVNQRNLMIMYKPKLLHQFLQDCYKNMFSDGEV